MKKFIWFIGIAAIITGSVSCKKQLDLAPEDYYGEGNYWQNETQVSTFMVGIHKQLRDNQFMFLRLGEMRGGTYSNIDRQATSLNELTVIENRIDENSAGVSNWAGFYGPILQINLFINKVEGIGFLTANQKNYLLGQAYGIRAYYYFHLLRTYGGVPLRLTPDAALQKPDQVELRMPRSSEAEVLAAIKSDVNKSLELFGTQPRQGVYFWSAEASGMLKGEVYLWSAKVYNNTADLAEAKSALEGVTGFSLQPNFADVFNKKGNSEIIFALRYAVNEAEMSTVSFYTYSTFNFDNQHYKDSAASGPTLVDPLNIAQTNSMQIIQRYAYTFELFKAYDVKDTRRDVTFYDYYKVDKTKNPPVPTIRNTALVKFLGEINSNKRYFTSDWPVYREADRILMLAEIANAQGADPTQYIKAIRDRAFGGAGKDPRPFVNGTKDQNEIAIFEERMKEFVHEGKQWYDLRRMRVGGKPMVFKSTLHPYGVLDEATKAYMVLWPINAGVWTDDPTVNQTPGYPTLKP